MLWGDAVLAGSIWLRQSVAIAVKTHCHSLLRLGNCDTGIASFRNPQIFLLLCLHTGEVIYKSQLWLMFHFVGHYKKNESQFVIMGFFFFFFSRNPWLQLKKGSIFLKVKEHGLCHQSQLSGRVVVSSHSSYVLFLRNLVISEFKGIAIHSLKTWVMFTKIILLSAELLSWRSGYSFLKEKLSLQFKIYKDSFVLCTYSCMTLNTIMN